MQAVQRCKYSSRYSAVETAQVWEKDTLHRKESREGDTRNKRQKQTGQTRNRVPMGYLRIRSILHLTAIRRTLHYTRWLRSRGNVPCLEAQPLRRMPPPHFKPRQTLPGKRTLLKGWSQLQTAFSGSSHLPDIYLTSTVPQRKISVRNDEVPFPFRASVSASAKWREGGTRVTSSPSFHQWFPFCREEGFCFVLFYDIKNKIHRYLCFLPEPRLPGFKSPLCTGNFVTSGKLLYLSVLQISHR